MRGIRIFINYVIFAWNSIKWIRSTSKSDIQYLHEIDAETYRGFKKISLRFADLSFTDLTRAKGITEWDLAGSNLTGARLPEGFQFNLLKQSSEALRLAVVTYTAMLVALFGSWLVRLSVSDLEVIKSGVETKLPLLGIAVDIHFFYWLTPVMIIAMHIYFQLLLQRILVAVVNLPIFFPDGLRIDQKLYPWPLMNVSELFHGSLWRVASGHSKWKVIFTIFLFWVVVPLSIIAIWAHYLEAHDIYISSSHCAYIVLCLGVDLYFIRRSFRIIDNSYSYHRKSLEKELTSVLGIKRIGQINYSKEKLDARDKDLRRWKKQISWALGIVMLILGSLSFFCTKKVVHGEIGEWCEKKKLCRALTTINMDYLDCQGCVFRTYWYEKRHLENLSAKHAKLQKSIFIDAILKNADFTDADLTGANLKGADLSGADLKGSVLNSSSLINATLDSANLTEASLEGVKLRGANIKGIFMLDSSNNKIFLNKNALIARGANFDE